MVQTDVSALPPPPAQQTRAQFRSNPVANTLQFDNSLPPDAIQRYGGNGGLTVPNQGRQRAASLDGRNARPHSIMMPEHFEHPQPPTYGRQPPVQPPQRKMSRFTGVEDYGQPAVRYNGGGPPQQSLRGRLPQNDDSDGSDSDEDKFTAVSSGVQQDEPSSEDDDDDGTLMEYQQRSRDFVGMQATSYGRDPRDGGHYHQRSLSAMGGFDNRSQARVQQVPDPRGAGYDLQMKAQRKNSTFGGVQFQDQDFGSNGYSTRNGGLAPPQAIVRPSSAGAVRRPVSAQDTRPPPPVQAPAVQQYKAAPPPATSTPFGSVPEDTPEEKNLIRLLKVRLPSPSIDRS
jgi:hypothetical protein